MDMKTDSLSTVFVSVSSEHHLLTRQQNRMPEYLVALILSAIAGGYTMLQRKIDSTDEKIDRLELKVSEQYVSKSDVSNQFLRLWDTLHRMEEKLDAHVSENKVEIQRIKDKYYHD